MLDTLPALEIEELTSGNELRAVIPEWEQLWERSPTAPPFQMPGWLIAWWEHFGDGKELWALGLREQDALVGMVPLCIHHEQGVRKVMLVGVAVSDYVDALFAPGFESLGASLACEHLARHATRWDACDLQPLLKDSPFLSAEFPGEPGSSIGKVETCTRLALPGNCLEFRRHFSAHFRKRFSAAKRNAEAIGEVRFELASPQTFDDSFHGLMHLHRARWKARNEPGLVNSAAAEQFHRDAASSLLDHGELRLWLLKIGSRAAGALYAFIHRQRLFLYLSGFDPEFEKVSPGVLLITHAIEQAISEGASDCEFLRGREAYKYRWDVREFATYARRLLHG